MHHNYSTFICWISSFSFLEGSYSDLLAKHNSLYSVEDGFKKTEWTTLNIVTWDKEAKVEGGGAAVSSSLLIHPMPSMPYSELFTFQCI